jgi:uncharacterized membrane protein
MDFRMGRKRRDTQSSVLLTSAALGALSGLRGTAAPALLSHELAESRDDPANGLARLLSSETAASVLTLVASGELLFDRGLTGGRAGTGSPIPLVGRAIMGSLTAAAFASARRQSVILPAILGGAAALATTAAARKARRLARRHYNVPDRVIEMVEDALVIGAGKGISSVMDG